MESERYSNIKKDIEGIIKKSPLEWDLVHSGKVLFWLLKLKPDADEILKIAALAHDMERGATGITEITHLKDYGDIKQFKKEHTIRSANIAEGLLKKHGYGEEEIKRARKLIENHEEGGDEETNTLRDADSVAFFDYNLEPTLNRNKMINPDAVERTKSKIKFMFNRVSPKAQKIIKDLKYDNPEIQDLIKAIKIISDQAQA